LALSLLCIASATSWGQQPNPPPLIDGKTASDIAHKLNYGNDSEQAEAIQELANAIMSRLGQHGNTYDDCILQHVPSAPNTAAVYAVERACIRESSIDIPSGVALSNVIAYAGRYNNGSGTLGSNGLVISFVNSTKFDITGLLVIIRNKSTGQVTQYRVPQNDSGFIDAPGVMLAAPPEPAFASIIKASTSRRVFVQIDEPVTTDFFKESEYGVIPAKGIPTD
jgi:hypothetical protein